MINTMHPKISTRALTRPTTGRVGREMSAPRPCKTDLFSYYLALSSYVTFQKSDFHINLEMRERESRAGVGWVFVDYRIDSD